MNRTLFYDRVTGELLHSHYEVRVVKGGDNSDAQLSEPAAVELDTGMAELVSRGLDPQRLASLTTNLAPQSSRRMEHSVDVTTGQLRSRRLEMADEASQEET
jgi:hypothetical protein